jgi:transposase
VDGRKNINGLALLVVQAMGLDPFAAVFVFSNRRRDRIKLLLWDRTGFWLMLKRLESDRFVWPKDAAVAELSVEQLHWLLATSGRSGAASRLTRTCRARSSVTNCRSQNESASMMAPPWWRSVLRSASSSTSFRNRFGSSVSDLLRAALTAS